MKDEWDALDDLVADVPKADEKSQPKTGDYINNGNTVLTIEGKRFVQGAVIDVPIPPDLLAFFLANGHVIKV